MPEEMTKKERTPKRRTDSNNVMIMQTCLEEHRALRNEIEQHHVSMRYIFIFNVTASGTIFSFALSNVDTLASLFLIIPMLSSIFGIVFFFHSRRMSQLGHYIRCILAPKIRLLTNDNSVLNWEYYIRQRERSSGWLTLFSLDGIRLLTYIFISGFGIGTALAFDVNNPVLLGFGSLLTAVLILLTIIERSLWLNEKKEQT